MLLWNSLALHYTRSSLLIGGVLLVVAVLVWITWLLNVAAKASLSAFNGSPDAHQKVDLYLKSVGIRIQMLTGLTVLGGLYFAAQQFGLARAQAQASLDVRAEENRIHNIDTMATATSQLGSSEEPIRIGGIYILGDYANQSSDQARAVMEILSSFIRTSKSRPERTDDASIPLSAFEDDKFNRYSGWYTGPRLRPSFWDYQPWLVSPDTQAAFNALGRITSYDIENYAGASYGPTPIQLQFTDLKGLVFSQLQISWAAFNNDDLGFSKMESTEFEGCNFRRTTMRYVHFYRSNYTYCNFSDADLSNSGFFKSDYEDCEFDGSILRGCVIEWSYFTKCSMAKAVFDEAIVDRAEFCECSLGGASFRSVELKGEVDFENADMKGVDFRGADLRGAKNLSPAQLAGCLVDASTKMPVGQTR